MEHRLMYAEDAVVYRWLLEDLHTKVKVPNGERCQATLLQIVLMPEKPSIIVCLRLTLPSRTMLRLKELDYIARHIGCPKDKRIHTTANKVGPIEEPFRFFVVPQNGESRSSHNFVMYSARFFLERALGVARGGHIQKFDVTRVRHFKMLKSGQPSLAERNGTCGHLHEWWDEATYLRWLAKNGTKNAPVRHGKRKSSPLTSMTAH